MAEAVRNGQPSRTQLHEDAKGSDISRNACDSREEHEEPTEAGCEGVDGSEAHAGASLAALVLAASEVDLPVRELRYCPDGEKPIYFELEAADYYCSDLEEL